MSRERSDLCCPVDVAAGERTVRPADGGDVPVRTHRTWHGCGCMGVMSVSPPDEYSPIGEITTGIDSRAL